MSEENKNGEQKPRPKLKRRKPSELGRNDMENIRFLGDDYYTVSDSFHLFNKSKIF
jgi:hypothetical protein